MIYKYIFFVFFFTITASSQDRPKWAQNLPNLPDLPDYYQGLGAVEFTGNTEADWQKAITQARTDLLSQIRVRIRNTVRRKVEENRSSDSQTISDVFQSTTDQICEGTLEGIPTQRWYDKKSNIFYAYISVSKSEIDTKFNDILRNAISSAKISFNGGREAIQQGNIYFGIGQYTEAMKIIYLAEIYLNKVLLGDIDGSNRDQPVLSIIQNEFCGVLEKIRFEIISGNEQLGEKFTALKRPLTGKITYLFPSAVIPVSKAKLLVSFVSPAAGNLSGLSQSDDKGLFEINVTEVKEGEAVNKVRVCPDFRDLSELSGEGNRLNRCWENLFVDFIFQMRVRTNVKIALYIFETKLGNVSTKSFVQEEIQNNLIEGHYNIIEESKIFKSVTKNELDKAVKSGNYNRIVEAISKIADFIVIGFVDSKQRSNPMTNIYFATGTALIRVIDAKSGRIVASSKIEAEKEGGGSYEIAAINALRKIGKQLGSEIKINIEKAL